MGAGDHAFRRCFVCTAGLLGAGFAVRVGIPACRDWTCAEQGRKHRAKCASWQHSRNRRCPCRRRLAPRHDACPTQLSAAAPSSRPVFISETRVQLKASSGRAGDWAANPACREVGVLVPSDRPPRLNGMLGPPVSSRCPMWQWVVWACQGHGRATRQLWGKAIRYTMPEQGCLCKARLLAPPPDGFDASRRRHVSCMVMADAVLRC